MNPPAPTSPPVTAVVVTYQSAQTIGAALAALRSCHDAGLVACVIVDNGSVDGTPDVVERETSWATVVLTGRNNGFGRGCNIGFGKVRTPYTLFVNPDAVVEPDAVRTMLGFMEQNAMAGIVGPAIIEGDGHGPGELQMTGVRPTPRTLLRAATPLLSQPPLAHPILPGAPPVRTEWVCGAVLMIRSSLMRQLGGFDPRFFLYWEEMDLCKRAEASGFGTWALGGAVAHHVGGASSPPDETRISGSIARHYYQSRYYYMIKHHGRLQAAAAELGEYAMLVVRALGDVIRGRGLGRLRPRWQAPPFTQPERDRA